MYVFVAINANSLKARKIALNYIKSIQYTLHTICFIKWNGKAKVYWMPLTWDIIFKIAEPSLGCLPFTAGRASTIVAAKKIKYLSTG